jgi:uncharacterized protein
MAQPAIPSKHSASALDIATFCREGAELKGQSALASMPRLVSGLNAVPADAVANWQAHGKLQAVLGGASQMWLHLQGQAKVLLQCQRCLQDMSEAVTVDRRIRFVRSEAEAARLDEESEDDVLALVPRLDLNELLEDELILSLPLVPMHTTCPEPLLPLLPLQAPLASGPGAQASAQSSNEAPHPFAALAALRAKLPKSGDA